MENQFEVKDEVKFLGKGPVMTITRIEPNGDCKCIWFTKDEHYQEQIFHSDWLHSEAKIGVSKRSLRRIN